MSVTSYALSPSPIGTLLLAGDTGALQSIWFQGGRHAETPDPAWVPDERPFREVIRQLDAYFTGRLIRFDVPLAPSGSPFQQRVWRQLLEIPYGDTLSYGELASLIGRPGAARAVGAANGRNPIPIIIPCHRVIGSTGTLVGYGGGLRIKSRLLALERGALPFEAGE